MSYNSIIEEVFDILGDSTPLYKDCGKLCGHACCKGDGNIGMELFPNEETVLKVLSGERNIAVCDGNCRRNERPLSCRFFPFIPYVHPDGHISAQIDGRAIKVCPLAENADIVKFNKDFLIKVRKAGRIMYRDPECREKLKEISLESDSYKKLFGYNKKFSKRR